MRKAAFSLIELIAVMAIIIVLVGALVPSLISTLSGSQLSQASQQVVRQLDSARQSALSQNRIIEVRFYKYTDTATRPASYQAYQAFVKLENGTFLPLNPVQKLPNSIILNMATLMTSFIGTGTTNLLEYTSDATIAQPANIPATFSYFKFQFRPDGSTNLTSYTSVDSNNNKLWYFTLCSQNATGVPPPNYATIQIDPRNGDLRTYRP